LLLSTHYRQQLNFTFKGLEAAKNTVDRLMTFMHRLMDAKGEECGEAIMALMGDVQKRFEEAMDDDLNISLALAALFDFVRAVNKLMDDNMLSKGEAEEVSKLMMRFDKVLGVIGKIQREDKLSKEAEDLIRKREEARKAKDWATADKIRQQLRRLGILIEDTPQGLKWRIEKH
ncbi:cysteine--tRNA ligase, partial [Candidatus Bathyarchaeota archaeon]|nr:cysteine--tRNA ligase [Candidatus Bathyarchaeota archaeon]